MTFVDTAIAQPPSDATNNPELVNMWRSAIMKARQLQEQKPEPTHDGALIINFDGAGTPLTVGMGGLPQMPPGAWRILGCHIAAGIWNPTSLRLVPIIVSASVELRLSHVNNWAGGSAPLYGDGGFRPGLISQSEASVDITGWLTELQPGDVISYALATFTGNASVITVTLPLRRIELTGLSETAVIDSTGDVLVDSAGRSIVIRG